MSALSAMEMCKFATTHEKLTHLVLAFYPSLGMTHNFKSVLGETLKCWLFNDMFYIDELLVNFDVSLS